MEQHVDTVSAICLDSAAISRFGVFFDYTARVPEGHAGFHKFYSVLETFAGGFDNANGFGVCKSFGTNVVGFI